MLDQCTPEQRRDVFNHLRQEFPIHNIEQKLNTQAEIILEAISRAPDITQRGIRGIIAESVFVTEVIGLLTHEGWQDKEIITEQPYDVLLGDGNGDLRIQVKMQRLTKGSPTRRKDYPGMYVVETQRTRSGTQRTSEGIVEKTRPYRFGDFDILAVSLHPSTGQWLDFRYTVADWLLPDPHDSRLLKVFQPVSSQPNDDWADNLPEAISWFREHKHKRISAQAARQI